MKLQKYIDLTEAGAEYEVRKYMLAGWKLVHTGLTLIILETEI